MNDITIPLHAPLKQSYDLSPFKGVFVAWRHKIQLNMVNVVGFDKK